MSDADRGSTRSGAGGAPQRSSPGALLELQHRAGNAAVSAFLQPPRDGAERALEAELAATKEATPPPFVEALAQGGGQPIDPNLRAVAEARLGRDLRHVRVHTDAPANHAAAAIGANAFTRGTHIWLGPGKTAVDRRLMLHELTHVVQQAEGRAAGLEGMGGEPSVRGALEAEADAVSRSGAAVSRGAGEGSGAVIAPSVGVGAAAPVQADVASDLQHEASIGYRRNARAELYAQRERLRTICRSATPEEAARLVERLRRRDDPLTAALRHRFHVAVQREIRSLLEQRAAAAPPPAPVQPAPQPEPTPEPPASSDSEAEQEIEWQRRMAERRRRSPAAVSSGGSSDGEHESEPQVRTATPEEERARRQFEHDLRALTRMGFLSLIAPSVSQAYERQARNEITTPILQQYAGVNAQSVAAVNRLTRDTAVVGFGGAGAAWALLSSLAIAGFVVAETGAAAGLGSTVARVVGEELAIARFALRRAGMSALTFYLNQPILVNELGVLGVGLVIACEGDVGGLLRALAEHPEQAVALAAEVLIIHAHARLPDGTQRDVTLRTRPLPPNRQTRPNQLLLHVEAVEQDASPRPRSTASRAPSTAPPEEVTAPAPRPVAAPTPAAPAPPAPAPPAPPAPRPSLRTRAQRLRGPRGLVLAANLSAGAVARSELPRPGYGSTATAESRRVQVQNGMAVSRPSPPRVGRRAPVASGGRPPAATTPEAPAANTATPRGDTSAATVPEAEVAAPNAGRAPASMVAPVRSSGNPSEIAAAPAPTTPAAPQAATTPGAAPALAAVTLPARPLGGGTPARANAGDAGPQSAHVLMTPAGVRAAIEAYFRGTSLAETGYQDPIIVVCDGEDALLEAAAPHESIERGRTVTAADLRREMQNRRVLGLQANNHIFLDGTALRVETMLHETLHHLSSPAFRNRFAGAINEGATHLLTLSMLEHHQAGLGTAAIGNYTPETLLAMDIRALVGHDLFERAYFRGGQALQELLERVDAVQGRTRDPSQRNQRNYVLDEVSATANTIVQTAVAQRRIPNLSPVRWMLSPAAAFRAPAPTPNGTPSAPPRAMTTESRSELPLSVIRERLGQLRRNEAVTAETLEAWWHEVELDARRPEERELARLLEARRRLVQPATTTDASPQRPAAPPVAYPAEATPGQREIVEALLRRVDREDAIVDRDALSWYLNERRANLAAAIDDLRGYDTAAGVNGRIWSLVAEIAPTVLPAREDPAIRGDLVRRSHDIGVAGGTAEAERRGLHDVGFQNPFEHIGGFGQGIDDVRVHGDDLYRDPVWICEYKGESAEESEGQMELAWVITNIQRLQVAGGAVGQRWAVVLARALRESRLRGITIRTRTRTDGTRETVVTRDVAYPPRNLGIQ